ncbi:MAG: hypothetical protein AAGH65_11915, partial [Pseudomonadota bacterium]
MLVNRILALPRIILIFAILCLGVSVEAQVPASQDQHDDVALSSLLDADGEIHLPEGFSGSIDPTGFAMVRGPDGSPRFIPIGRGSNDQWSEGEFALPGCNSAVLAIVSVNGIVYIGGTFESCGFAVASRVARFDPVSGEFSSLGDGVNGTVLDLVAIGTDLYVGGNFGQAGGAPAERIARYDTTQTGNAGWSALGAGVDRTVRALAAVGTDLYVGGEFREAGGASLNRIARYDTTQTGNAGWSALGDGTSSTVWALTTNGTDLYVGGSFSQAGGVSVNRIARYDTTQTGNAGWSALGTGVNGTVFAIAAIDTDIYVGGA